jgi:hypothetical protein
MALFGWGSKAKAAVDAGLDTAIGDIFDPPAVLRALDRIVPKYLDRVDKHDLIYPACTRKPADADGNVRAVWEHTRLEAMRYLVMVPGRDSELLIAPARQDEMIAAFLRLQPHENTVIDFTGVATEDIGAAVIAGFNWLNHCASLAGVQRDKVARTLTGFRKVVRLGQQWWETEGAGARSQQMLAERQKPPLMLYLVWSDYTRLAKEIACAAIYGAPVERALEKERARLGQELSEQPAELRAAFAALSETMDRLARAEDPEDLARPE